MKIKNKNRATVITLSCAAFALFAGSFALFSDRAETNTSGKVGKLGISLTDVEMTNSGNINPGDNDERVDKKASTTPHDITFTVANNGNKSIRTRHTLMFTVKDENGKILDPTVMSILKDKGLEVSGKKYIDANGNESENKTANTTGIKYTVLSDSFSGVGSEAESESDAKSEAQTYKYLLKMDKDAKNIYQGANFNLDVVVDAMQYRNTTNSNWTEVASEKITGNLTGISTETAPSR